MPKVGDRYKHRYSNWFITLTKKLKTREDLNNCKSHKKMSTDFLLSNFYYYGPHDIGNKVKDVQGRAWTIHKIWDSSGAIDGYNVDVKEKCMAFRLSDLKRISWIEYKLRRFFMYLGLIKGN